jgi:hypothetical protein
MTNLTLILRYRDAIYISIILLLILFRSSGKSQKNDIIQSEKKIDSIQFEIKQAKQQIPNYEKTNVDSINHFQPTDLEIFLSKRYDNKNSN